MYLCSDDTRALVLHRTRTHFLSAYHLVIKASPCSTAPKTLFLVAPAAQCLALLAATVHHHPVLKYVFTIDRASFFFFIHSLASLVVDHDDPRGARRLNSTIKAVFCVVRVVSFTSPNFSPYNNIILRSCVIHRNGMI